MLQLLAGFVYAAVGSLWLATPSSEMEVLPDDDDLWSEIDLDNVTSSFILPYLAQYDFKPNIFLFSAD